MGVTSFFSKLKWWDKKPADDMDARLSKIGLFTNADTKLPERLAEYQTLVTEFNTPITGAPDVRLKAWLERLQIAYFTYKRIAVPYLRVMDSENRIYGVALDAYEQLYRYTMTYFGDFQKILSRDNVNKEEAMYGFEFWLEAYVFKWMFTIIDWSFTGQDVAPSYSVTTQSMMPQQGHTLPAGVGPGFQNPQQQKD